jgi:hypothetical protein
MTWWPWSYPSVPTFTSDGTGRSPGECCRCREYGMVLLNGQTFYCWEHYCALMQSQRERAAIGQLADKK